MATAMADTRADTAATGRSPILPLWVVGAAAAAASGAMMAACFRPLRLSLLAWVAMVPWFTVLPRLGPARTWLLGTLLALVFYRFGLAWGLTLAGPIGGAVIVILSVWMGFSFRVARLLMDRWGTSAMLWALPLTFVGQELIRCEGLPRLRLPFLAIGYTQSEHIWLAQIASLAGVYGLSGLVVLVNAAVAYGLCRRSLGAFAPAGGAVLLVVGLASISQSRVAATGREVSVACIQAEPESSRAYVHLVREALRSPTRPAVVVLPEHAIVDFADEGHPTVRGLAELARAHQAFICVGAHVAAPRGAPCPYDNVGLLIAPDGRIVSIQPKQVPLPFFQDGNPGQTQTTAPSPYGVLGMLICYDGLFTDIPRRLADRGAELLLVPVMDADRWPAQERWQHADMAPMRSIELRRCALRAASSGVSQIIDARGRIIAERPREAGPGILCGTVYSSQVRSPFLRGGYLLAPLAAVLFLGLVFVLTVSQWARALGRFIRGRSVSS